MPAKKISRKKNTPIHSTSSGQKNIPASRISVKNLFNAFAKYKFKIIGLILVLLILTSLWFAKNLIVVAMVNGRPIWRLTLIKELENQGGKKTLDMLITKQLLIQEADKQKIKVTKEEIDQEIKTIETTLTQRGQNLDQLLQAQNMTRVSLADQIGLQKLAEKMAGNIEVSEQEINDYYEQNKEFSFKDTSLEQVKNNIKQQLLSQKVNEKIQTLIQSLQEKAKIKFF